MRAAYEELEMIARSGIIDDIAADPLLTLPDYQGEKTALVLRNPAGRCVNPNSITIPTLRLHKEAVIHRSLTVPFEMTEEK